MIRITGGELRGRLIRTPKGILTRPTQAKVRQSLFNSLQTVTPGARVLDLFAGSGALGFEALSRGAEFAVFVESSRDVARLIRQNAEDFKVLDQVEILSQSVEQLVRDWGQGGALPGGAGFDLVLLDPPYAESWESKLLEWPWSALLAPQAVVAIEWSPRQSKAFPGGELPPKIGLLEKYREKPYGETTLTTYRLENKA